MGHHTRLQLIRLPIQLPILCEVTAVMKMMNILYKTSLRQELQWRVNSQINRKIIIVKQMLFKVIEWRSTRRQYTSQTSQIMDHSPTWWTFLSHLAIQNLIAKITIVYSLIKLLFICSIIHSNNNTQKHIRVMKVSEASTKIVKTRSPTSWTTWTSSKI